MHTYTQRACYIHWGRGNKIYTLSKIPSSSRLWWWKNYLQFKLEPNYSLIQSLDEWFQISNLSHPPFQDGTWVQVSGSPWFSWSLHSKAGLAQSLLVGAGACWGVAGPTDSSEVLTTRTSSSRTQACLHSWFSQHLCFLLEGLELMVTFSTPWRTLWKGPLAHPPRHLSQPLWNYCLHVSSQHCSKLRGIQIAPIYPPMVGRIRTSPQRRPSPHPTN